eukprot:1140130-Rhodomonas_salina.1
MSTTRKNFCHLAPNQKLVQIGFRRIARESNNNRSSPPRRSSFASLAWLLVPRSNKELITFDANSRSLRRKKSESRHHAEGWLRSSASSRGHAAGISVAHAGDCHQRLVVQMRMH